MSGVSCESESQESRRLDQKTLSCLTNTRQKSKRRGERKWSYIEGREENRHFTLSRNAFSLMFWSLLSFYLFPAVIAFHSSAGATGDSSDGDFISNHRKRLTKFKAQNNRQTRDECVRNTEEKKRRKRSEEHERGKGETGEGELGSQLTEEGERSGFRQQQEKTQLVQTQGKKKKKNQQMMRKKRVCGNSCLSYPASRMKVCLTT